MRKVLAVSLVVLLPFIFGAADLVGQDEMDTTPERISVSNIKTRILSAGELFIEFKLDIEYPGDVVIDDVNYVVRTYRNTGPTTQEPTIALVSNTEIEGEFPDVRSNSLHEDIVRTDIRYCAEIEAADPVLINIEVFVKAIKKDGSEIIREIKAFPRTFDLNKCP